MKTTGEKVDGGNFNSVPVMGREKRCSKGGERQAKF